MFAESAKWGPELAKWGPDFGCLWEQFDS